MSLIPKCCGCLVYRSDALALQAFSYLEAPVTLGGWAKRQEGVEGGRDKEREKD